MSAVRAWLLGALLLLLLAGPAQAHKPSDSYLGLTLQAGQLSGRWDIALRDLDFAIGLDADGDGNITWGEVRARHAAIAAYASARLAVQADGQPCTVTVGEQLVDEHTDGAYTVMPLALACKSASPHTLTLDYRLFADLDPKHRGLLNLTVDGTTSTAILGPHAPSQQFRISAPASGWQQLLDYGHEGVWHIWIGFDHILFLLSLLLPAVGVWRRSRWTPVEHFGTAFFDVLRIVTAFTVAHSITLSLAVLGWVTLPSRLVESCIAASVVLAAMNNVWPVFHGRRWMVAFGFGLIHGFGFASVLVDLGLPAGALARALVGFNLGVEVGQLAIVAAFLPTAYLLRKSAFYRRVVLTGCSLVIALLAAVWLAERALDLKLLPG